MERKLSFVTIDQASGYLDQLVVSPDAWGSPVGTLLMTEAKRLSPAGVTLKVNADNDRAIAFYRKHGFVRTGKDGQVEGCTRTWAAGDGVAAAAVPKLTHPPAVSAACIMNS